MSERKRNPGKGSEVTVWHDEADRLATWGALDPPDACMCRDCVLPQKGRECGWFGCGHPDCADFCTPDPPETS